MAKDAETRRPDGQVAPTEGGRVALGPERRPRRVDSMTLLAGAREIEIAHRGEVYRLRWTSKDKLILTK